MVAFSWYWIQKSPICFRSNCFHVLAPVYLSEYLALDKNVPMAKTHSEQRSFCFNGVRDFNMLPSHVKNISSDGQFRSKLNIELGY